MEDDEQSDLVAEGEDNVEVDEAEAVWEHLSPEQKKYFKKLAEKTKENMNYIG